MFGRVRRRAVERPEVEFCEQCGQVCGSTCRAEERRERVRAEVAYRVGLPR